MNAKEIEHDFTEGDYEDFLDNAYGDIDVCGLSYPAGQILKEVDPTAFRCGYSDYTAELSSTWECGECGAEYDDEDEAEECCQPEELEDDEDEND